MKIIKVFIQKNLTDNFVVKNFLNNYKPKNIEYFIDFNSIQKKLNSNIDYEQGKSILVFKNNQGNFIKKCPCAPGALSCNYYVMNIIQNCPLSCTYCYLQQYVNNNVILINCNLEKIEVELKNLSEKYLHNIRLGNGEFSDSLLFDEFTGITEYLMIKTKKFSNIIFEIKTKTDNIEHLINKNELYSNNIVFAWSVNPENVVETEELNAANLEKRLYAAQKVVSNGFNVAFHFDPIIFYNNWERDYFKVVKKIFDVIPENKILWFSLGTFRCNKELTSMIRIKYPESKIYKGEFIDGFDKKTRYIKKLRIKIYNKMISFIKSFSDKPVVYLCMENPKVWNDIKLYPEKIIKFNI